MPELPEVETTLRGIEPHVLNLPIERISIRESKLRWKVPKKDLEENLLGNYFSSIKRRAKYLILNSKKGSQLIHLGMSGSLRILFEEVKPQKHDHIDIVFKNNCLLRFTDPRKFGSFLWSKDPEVHPLLKDLGPEPLGNSFSGEYLFQVSRKRKVPLKNFIMNAKVLAGVGNIYASEALFLAGIRPQKRAGTISSKQYDLLAFSIKELLQNSIDKGGTTLKDFVGSDNKPGYFKNELMVYGRAGKACKKCSSHLKKCVYPKEAVSIVLNVRPKLIFKTFF